MRTTDLLQLWGCSQRELAARLKVSGTFVSAVCRGKSYPSIEMITALAAEGVDLRWYLGLDNTPPKPPSVEEEHRLVKLAHRLVEGGSPEIVAEAVGYLAALSGQLRDQGARSA